MKEILRLIPREYHKGGILVSCLVPLKAVLDLVGVATLIPVIMLVLDPDALKTSFIGTFAGEFGLDLTVNIDSNGFPFFIIACVVVVLLVKIGLSLLITSYQNRYMMKLCRNLCSRLFISFYSRGLLYIKNQNSTRMTFNVTVVCYNFVMNYLGGILALAGEAVFVSLLFVGLLILSPSATLVAVCSFLPGMLLYAVLVNKPLRMLKKKENALRKEQYHIINEAFRGYSEVQVNDAFPIIQNRFDRGLDEIATYHTKGVIIQTIPSHLLDLSVLTVVAVLTLFSIGFGGSSAMFLGVCAVALLKLLPAARSIISSLSSISAAHYTTEVIAEINTPTTFSLVHEDEIEPVPFKDALVVDDVSFCFEDDDKPVISHLNFRIPKGSRIGIRGCTGSGKTTLFNLLLGLYPPTQGRILIDDEVLDSSNVGRWHRLVGYVPQEVFVADSTILENVALGYDKDQIDRDKVAKALERASLLDFVNTLSEGMDSRIGESGCRLSGGQRQRLGIARALYKDAKVLFFDEATSSLDSQTEREVNEAIKTLSDSHSELTIIVISHRDSTLSFCSEILDI